jgi:glutathione S-transferase
MSLPTLYYSDPSGNLAQQLLLASFLNIELRLEHKAPLTLVDQKLIITDPNAISIHLAASSGLLGSSAFDQVEVYSWL